MLLFSNAKPLAREPYRPAIGTGATGEPVDIDPSNLKHWLISGQTGSGKSSWLNAILNVLQHQPFDLYGVDLKAGLELAPWSQQLSGLAENANEANEVISEVNTLMRQRLKILRIRGLRKWPTSERIALLVDELAETLAPDLAIEDKQAKQEARQRLAGLTSIARPGSAAGVSLIAATQHPLAHIVPTELRNNLQVRVCGRVEGREAISAALGAGYAEMIKPTDIPLIPGLAVVLGLSDKNASPQTARAYWEVEY